MSINKVTAGDNVPHEFNVIIEIPMNADPVKYEVDKDSGALFGEHGGVLDRLDAAMFTVVVGYYMSRALL